MEFYLINNGDLELQPGWQSEGPPVLERDSEMVEIEMEPCIKENGYFEGLVHYLVKNDSFFQKSQTSDRTTYLQMSISLPSSTEDNGKTTIMISSFVEFDDFGDRTGDIDIFKGLSNLFGHEHVKMNVQVTGFNYYNEDGVRNDAIHDWNFELKDMKLEALRDDDGDGVLGCKSQQLEFPSCLRREWFEGAHFFGKLTVTVSLSDEAITKLYWQTFVPGQFTDPHKMALEDTVFSDLIIVAENGARVKCHKIYLAVRSPVFKAMLESQMKERTTNSIAMPDMSEPGVRALLAFIYCWDLSEPSRSCDIALELYQAGHKYDIADLEKAMQMLIISKPNEWFCPDMTVKLFAFANQLNPGNDLVCTLKKSVQVLKWYTNTSYDKLRESLDYQHLFEKTPKAAMDLVAYFLKAT